MIYEKSKIDGRPSFAGSHWDNNMEIYYLSEKMRCCNDKKFAEVQDRVGKGILTPEDQDYLLSRVQTTELENQNESFKEGKVSIIVTLNKQREDLNREKLNSLIPDERAYTCFAVDRVMNITEQKEPPKDLPYTATGNLPPELIIKKGAPVVITTNHPKSVYKEEGICNGSRGYIDFIQVNDDDPEMVEIIWIVLNNQEFGRKLRSDNYHLRQNLPLHERSTPIFPQKKRFKINLGNVEYQRAQFPLNLAYALTSWKVQGATFDGAGIVDFRDGYIAPGSFYVAMTRVKEGDKLFLRDFKPSYIRSLKDVEEKIEEMRKEKPYTFFKHYLHKPCFKKDRNDLKVGYLNVNCLTDSLHLECVDNDRNLLNLDLLCLSDIRLVEKEQTQEVQKKFKHWNIVFRKDTEDKRKHMGLLFVVPKDKPNLWEGKFEIKEEIKSSNGTKAQVINVNYDNNLSFSFVYVNSKPSVGDSKLLANKVSGSSFVLGDINLDSSDKKDKPKINLICSEERVQHLKAITRKQEKQLDHIFVKKELEGNTVTDCYYHFGSDHKSIVLRYSHFENDEKVSEYMPVSDAEGTAELAESKIKSENDLDKIKSENDENEDQKLPLEKTVTKQKRRPKKGVKQQQQQPISDPYHSLNGTNWLDDEVINQYCNLIMKKHPDVFIFSTFFSQTFFTDKRPHATNKKFNKTKDLFSKRLVFFPLHQLSHWYLCYMDYENACLFILDPHIDKEMTIADIERLRNRYDVQLKKLEDEFLKVTYVELKRSDWKEMKRSIRFPPSIPRQKDDENCGCFLLNFIR